MSMSQVVAHDPRAVPFKRRILVRVVVLAARLLATQSPRRIRLVLAGLRHGSRPATWQDASTAREAVMAVSVACSGPHGCLPRSLATVLLCRLHGQFPTWSVGVRRLPPFGAHAWVEVDGVIVGEDYPPGYLCPLFTVTS